MQRHGARYPEKAPAKAIQKSVKKLKRAKKFKDSNLAFVKQYEYTLGIDDLVPFGAAQCVLSPSLSSLRARSFDTFISVPMLIFCSVVSRSFDAGQEHFVRYAALVDEEMLPFIRASESGRVIDSARNWTAGEILQCLVGKDIFLKQRTQVSPMRATRNTCLRYLSSSLSRSVLHQ